MSKGARAMVAAKIRSLNDRSMQETAKDIGVAKGYVAQAAIILEYTPTRKEQRRAGDGGGECARIIFKNNNLKRTVRLLQKSKTQSEAADNAGVAQQSWRLPGGSASAAT
jgi:hypothetical protein